MPATKLCPTCSTVKRVSDFNLNRARPDGLNSQCKECKRAVQRNWYVRNKARHVRNVARRRRAAETQLIKRILRYLRFHPCVDCGETNPVLLDFDHVRGKKVNSVCNLISRGFGWSTIEAEIGKCEVRCCRCHRLKTAKQFGYRRLLLSVEI